jgi:hypothetical protein
MRTPALIVVALFWLAACAHAPGSYDLVLQSGQVIHPETHLDAERDAGIRGDSIVRIGVIDARRLAATPGFIDLHQHGHVPEDLHSAHFNPWWGERWEVAYGDLEDPVGRERFTREP